jgi:hypothetical protein
MMDRGWLTEQGSTMIKITDAVLNEQEMDLLVKIVRDYRANIDDERFHFNDTMYLFSKDRHIAAMECFLGAYEACNKEPVRINRDQAEDWIEITLAEENGRFHIRGDYDFLCILSLGAVRHKLMMTYNADERAPFINIMKEFGKISALEVEVRGKSAGLH